MFRIVCRVILEQQGDGRSEIFTFDKVNKRELELGAAAMAALIYLIDTTEFH